jgi:hypothetical protein
MKQRKKVGYLSYCAAQAIFKIEYESWFNKKVYYLQDEDDEKSTLQVFDEDDNLIATCLPIGEYGVSDKSFFT